MKTEMHEIIDVLRRPNHYTRQAANDARIEAARILSEISIAVQAPQSADGNFIVTRVESLGKKASAIDDATREVHDGKKQWDDLARILGADGDNVDAVIARARSLATVEQINIAGHKEHISGTLEHHLLALADRLHHAVQRNAVGIFTPHQVDVESIRQAVRLIDSLGHRGNDKRRDGKSVLEHAQDDLQTTRATLRETLRQLREIAELVHVSELEADCIPNVIARRVRELVRAVEDLGRSMATTALHLGIATDDVVTLDTILEAIKLLQNSDVCERQLLLEIRAIAKDMQESAHSVLVSRRVARVIERWASRLIKLVGHVHPHPHPHPDAAQDIVLKAEPKS